MTGIRKDLPLPEVWRQLEGDPASKRETVARIVAERVRVAGLRGAPVGQIKQLLESGDLARIQALLDAGTGEAASAPHDVARHGLRAGGFSSLLAGVHVETTERTRAETLLAEGKVEEAVRELRTNPADRVELRMASAVRHLARGNLRDAYQAFEELERTTRDPAVKHLVRRFLPASWFARLRDSFKNPDPDSVTFSREEIAALGGRFALLREELTRLAGADGTVTVAKRQPSADFHAYIERGAALVPQELVELAETIRDREAAAAPGTRDMGLANLYRRGHRLMAEIRAQLLADSTVRPAAALRLAQTALPPEEPMVHQDRVYQDIAEAILLTGPSAMETIRLVSNTGTRAHAHRGFGDLNVARHGGGNKYTVFHEFGHHLEFNRPEVLAACRAWLEERCTGEPQPLNDLVKDGHYRPEEMARPDHFVSPYVGKVYDEMTEVVSMGLEHLTADHTMMKLLVKDPEHLYLTLGIVLANRP